MNNTVLPPPTAQTLSAATTKRMPWLSRVMLASSLCASCLALIMNVYVYRATQTIMHTTITTLVGSLTRYNQQHSQESKDLHERFEGLNIRLDSLAKEVEVNKEYNAATHVLKNAPTAELLMKLAHDIDALNVTTSPNSMPVKPLVLSTPSLLMNTASTPLHNNSFAFSASPNASSVPITSTMPLSSTKASSLCITLMPFLHAWQNNVRTMLHHIYYTLKNTFGQLVVITAVHAPRGIIKNDFVLESNNVVNAALLIQRLQIDILQARLALMTNDQESWHLAFIDIITLLKPYVNDNDNDNSVHERQAQLPRYVMSDIYNQAKVLADNSIAVKSAK